jgi:hypothetical protein
MPPRPNKYAKKVDLLTQEVESLVAKYETDRLLKAIQTSLMYRRPTYLTPIIEDPRY